MDLEHGKKHPWLLTTSQTFQVFAVLFGCNVTLLIALVHGAAKNQDALESIAKSAENAREAEIARVREAEAPQVREVAQKLEAHPAEPTRPSGLQISMPEGWKWRGCRASDSGDSVEILLGR